MFLKYRPEKGLINQTVDFIANRVKNVTTGSTQVHVSEIASGQGWAGKIQDTNVAVYNNDGELIVLQNVCTHRKCQTDWNQNEQTWDCPCHGSKYNSDGSLLRGPAKNPLSRLDYAVEDGQIVLK